jgi:murein DD-endopeptidase MepM/ murein hydrolase activator NlpD
MGANHSGGLANGAAVSRTTLKVAAAPAVSLTIGPEGSMGGARRYAQRSAVGHAVVVSFSAAPATTWTRRSATMPGMLPISAARLTSGFGERWHPLRGGYRFHSGVDLAAPAGSPLAVTSDGVVTIAGYSGGYGLMVAVDHGGGIETRYGHLSGLKVAVGQAVKAGQTIGYVGSTGESTGPHVHYEVRVNGRAVNPL